jgi:hypothetical protein
MKSWKKILQEEGSFPILAIIMIGLLIFTGLGYMKWGADESLEVSYQKAKLQAYYAAHGGVIDIGYKDLRSLSPGTIPPEPVSLGGGVLTDYKGNVTSYIENVIRAPDINEIGTAMADYNYVDIISVGRVNTKGYDGKEYAVFDTVTMKVKLLGLANFLYLTDIEVTTFGEVIKFWGADTLDGWVHSNDTISMMAGGGGPGPVFYDKVSTTAPIINIISGQPQYLGGDPMLQYREIYLPTEATEIRNAAAAGGTFFDDNWGNLASRLVFNDRQGWILYQWTFGTPFDSSAVVATGPAPIWQAIFVDGYLELQGIVRGQVTVGARGHANPSPEFYGYHCIRLMDDIRYYFASSTNGQFNDTTQGYTDILGIVSESNITIGNTWANGRRAQEQGANIIITAAMVALGESFSFEDQNEPPPALIWEFYTGNYNFENTDERGDIFLHGAVTQKRRGYVHRSNYGGTGYGKQYWFDSRLSNMSPPYFLEATDSEGHAHFEVISWGND